MHEELVVESGEFIATSGIYRMNDVSPDPSSRFANIGNFTLSGEPQGQGPGLFGSLQTEFGYDGSTGDSARGLPSDKSLYAQLDPAKGQTEDDMITGLYKGFVAVGNANVQYWPWGNQPGQNNGNSNNTAYTEAEYANVLGQFNAFSSGFHAPGSNTGVPINQIVAAHNATLGGGGVSSNGVSQPNSNSWWTTPNGAVVTWGGSVVASPSASQHK